MKRKKKKKMIVVGLLTGSIVVTSVAGCQMMINYNNKPHTIEHMEGLKDSFSIK